MERLPDYTVNAIGSIQALSEQLNWGLRDLNIPDHWSKTRGKGVRVMVIDSGNTTHPDVKDNINYKLSKNFIPNEKIDDFVGHNTHVSGIIGASNNAFGVVGVAPDCEIINVKALDKNGFSTSHSVLDSIKYAIKIKPDVINMSLGSFQRQTDIEPFYKELVYTHNIPIVCAAGNFGKKGVMYPALYPYTISVGSYKPTRIISDFSAFSKNNYVDYVAPGDEILSTYLNDEYAILSGSSMAAPFVTGIIALIIAWLRSNNKSYTAQDIRNLLTNSCIDIGPKGLDNRHGYGIIDFSKVVDKLNSFSMPVKLELKAPLTWIEKLKNKIALLFM